MNHNRIFPVAMFLVVLWLVAVAIALIPVMTDQYDDDVGPIVIIQLVLVLTAIGLHVAAMRGASDRMKGVSTQVSAIVISLLLGFVLAPVIAYVDTDLGADWYDIDDLNTEEFAVLLAFFCYALLRVLPFLRRSLEAYWGKDPDDMNDKGSVHQVVVQMRRRAERLRRAAFGSLIIIIVSLAGGTIVFLQAGTRAQEEADLDTREYLNNRNSIEAQERERANAARERQALLSKPMKTAEEVQRLDELGLELPRLEDEIKQLKTLQDELLVNSRESRAADQSLSVYLSSLTTRTGVVLLLIFLVRILTQQYKYNIRLASFLSARADCLQLAGTNLDTLPRFVELLGTDGIDYTDQLRSEADHLLKLAREAIRGATNVRKVGTVATKEASPTV